MLEALVAGFFTITIYCFMAIIRMIGYIINGAVNLVNRANDNN